MALYFTILTRSLKLSSDNFECETWFFIHLIHRNHQAAEITPPPIHAIIK